MPIEIMKFCGPNLLADITPVISSEAVNFPKENLADPDWKKRWHSRHGYGSEWGFFTITASVNDRLDFDEGGGELTANLTPGNYSASTLAAHIKAQMDAVGANTYYVNFEEAGSYEFKWKIARSAGSSPVNLRCNTGTNKARSIYTYIGYSDAADRTGGTTYYGDDIALHTQESVKWIMGSSKPFKYFALIGHNLTSSVVIKVQFSNDNFASTPVDQALTKCGDNIYAYVWSTAQNYSYARLAIIDPKNPDGYVAIGYPAAGTIFQPSRNFRYDPEEAPEDPSIITPALGGQKSALLYDHFTSRAYSVRIKGSSDLASYRSHFDNFGISKPFFFIEDPGSLTSKIFFVHIAAWTLRCIVYSTPLYELNFSIEDARG